jgi:hypothetical protein
MRDKERIKLILNKFERIWKLYPDLRFCQIVSNITIGTSYNNDIFYIPDDEFEKLLDTELERMLEEKRIRNSL